MFSIKHSHHSAKILTTQFKKKTHNMKVLNIFPSYIIQPRHHTRKWPIFSAKGILMMVFLSVHYQKLASIFALLNRPPGVSSPALGFCRKSSPPPKKASLSSSPLLNHAPIFMPAAFFLVNTCTITQGRIFLAPM